MTTAASLFAKNVDATDAQGMVDSIAHVGRALGARWASSYIADLARAVRAARNAGVDVPRGAGFRDCLRSLPVVRAAHSLDYTADAVACIAYFARVCGSEDLPYLRRQIGDVLSLELA